MTSLLCVLILNNREGHNIFGNNQEPSQSDVMKALQLQHLDLMKALQLQRAQKDGMAHLKRKTTATITPPSVVNKEKEVVKRASELDFAIIGWPKTGKSYW
jgi:predicted GTPase